MFFCLQYEQMSSALLSGALIDIGINSKSWQGWQIPILTEGEHENARIINMNIDKINNFLKKKRGHGNNSRISRNFKKW